MSVIGNPITIGGGVRVPKPSGYLYNNGTWNVEVLHGLFSRNGAYVADQNSYITANLTNGATRAGGIVFGPLFFGDTISATLRGASSGDEYPALWALTDLNAFVMDYTPQTVEGGFSYARQVNANEWATLSLDTRSVKGKIGYIIVVNQVFQYANTRNDTRITNVSVTSNN